MDITIYSQTINVLVLILELAFTVAIGMYFTRRQSTIDEYIYGGHNMPLIPVCLSMSVSFTSAISIQGLAAEVYLYGIEIVFYSLSYLGAIFIVFTFLPLFYTLKITSVFEYFMLRFKNRGLYKCASLIGILTYMMYSSFVILAPAEALESLLGIPAVYNILIMSSICIMYTSLGGIKAVIWTDVFQSLIMVVGLMAVLVFGLTQLGVNLIWHELNKNGRTVLHYSPSLHNRTSIWLVLYNFFGAINTFTSQAAVARYTGVKNQRLGKLSVLFGCIGYTLFDIICIMAGGVVFAYYSTTGCGPLESEKISSANQIMPYFILNELNYPGLPGLFVAALIAGGLSSASSTLNASGVVLLKDFILPQFPNLSDRGKVTCLKLSIVFIGCITIGLTFIGKYTPGTIYQISTVTITTMAVPIGTAMLLGATIPYVSYKSVIFGGASALALVLWISVGSMMHGIGWEVSPPIDKKCFNNTYSLNLTSAKEIAAVAKVTTAAYYEEDSQFITTFYQDDTDNTYSPLEKLYRICPLSYSLIGSLSMYVIAAILSLFPWFRHEKAVDDKLLFPFIPKNWNQLEQESVCETQNDFEDIEIMM